MRSGPLRQAALLVAVAVVVVLATGCSSSGGEDSTAVRAGGGSSTDTTGGPDASLIPPSHTTNTVGGPPNTDPFAAAEAPSAERCGDGGESPSANASRLDLRVALGETLETGPVRWALVITNQSESEVTLQYPSSQDGDILLKRSDGSVAYQWSADEVFAQQVRCQVIGGRQQYRVELRGVPLDVPPGRYRLEASLASQPSPTPARVPVTVTSGG